MIEARSRPDDDPTASRRVVVVVNPATRGDPGRIIDRLRRAAPSGIALEVLSSQPSGTAALVRAALAGGARACVAVGGDGTVAEVASALRGTDIPLGVIPAGSTNITARSLGIPAGSRRAAALLFAPHRTVRLDLGLCDDHCFLNMAGAGLDSRIFERADPALKRRAGWLAYLPPALENLTMPPARFRIVADGVATEAVSPLVLVANGASVITPRLMLYPGIRPDDGWLDVLIFTPNSRHAIARTLLHLARQRLHRSPYVRHLRVRRVEIAADPPLPVELDGDVRLATPLAFSVAPAAVRVIVPSLATHVWGHS